MSAELDGEFHCVAPAADQYGEGRSCDDGLDCARGFTCCKTWQQMHTASSCVARAKVASECQWELCQPDGAKCPNGTSCVESVPVQGGVCEPPKGPATCVNGVRCPKEKPICALGPGGGTCVAEGSPEFNATPGNDRYECTRQSDCNGGDSCSFFFGETEAYVRTFCAKHGPSLGHLVCDPKGPQAKSCMKQSTPAALPWLGMLPLGG